MKLDLHSLISTHGLKPAEYVLIHVGASTCQEAEFYELFEFKEVIWIEALPDVYEIAKVLLKNFKNQSVINSLVWKEGNISFQLYRSSNDGESTSLLEPKDHLRIHPWVKFHRTDSQIVSTTLDEITKKYEEKRFFLVLDVQGAELAVIQGASETLSNTDFLFCEVSAIELYKDQALIGEIVNELEKNNFRLLKHDLTYKTPFGDALFLKRGTSRVENQSLSNSKLYFRFLRMRVPRLLQIFRKCRSVVLRLTGGIANK